MTDVLRRVARANEGVVPTWLLHREGMSWKAIEHHTRHLREIYDGVHVTGDAPVTRRQQWIGASLTAPGRWLAFASAGAVWEFRPWEGAFEVVVQEGSGGPQRFGDLLLCRAKVIHGTTFDGLRVTTAERTIADLWRKTGPGYRNKMLREALRLKRTTPAALDAHMNAAAPRNRPRSLKVLLEKYRRLDLHRTKSDAEARGLELLDDNGIELPEVNVEVARFEADYVWPHLDLIIEVDGDQWHQDKARDAEKTAAWTRAGLTVRRVEAEVIFRTPEMFVTGVRRVIAAAALPRAAA